MSTTNGLLPVVFGFVIGFALVAMVLLSADASMAQDVSLRPGKFTCLPSSTNACEMAIKATSDHRKNIADTRAQLTEHDRNAALRSVQFALSNVSDGASYVWHRSNGRVSSIVRPTVSFKDNTGRVCRHVVVSFTTGDLTRATETVACRRDSGVWELTG